MYKEVEPLCEKTLHAFVEINGLFLPCCFLTTASNHEKKLKELYGDDYEKLKLQNNTPEKIVKLWKKIADTWSTDNPLEMCKMACPKGTDLGKLKTQESKKR